MFALLSNFVGTNPGEGGGGGRAARRGAGAGGSGHLGSKVPTRAILHKFFRCPSTRSSRATKLKVDQQRSTLSPYDRLYVVFSVENCLLTIDDNVNRSRP